MALLFLLTGLSKKVAVTPTRCRRSEPPEEEKEGELKLVDISAVHQAPSLP